MNYKILTTPKTSNSTPAKETEYRGGGPTYAAAPVDVAAAEADKDAVPDPDPVAAPDAVSAGVAVADGEKLLAELALEVGGGVGMSAVFEYSGALAGVVTFVVVLRKPMTYHPDKLSAPFVNPLPARQIRKLQQEEAKTYSIESMHGSIIRNGIRLDDACIVQEYTLVLHADEDRVSVLAVQQVAVVEVGRVERALEGVTRQGREERGGALR